VASTTGVLVVRVDSEAGVDAEVDRMRAALPEARDVLRCRDFAALAGLDMGCDPFRQFLVESYAEGPPRETDGLIAGDEIDLFGVTEQVVGGDPFFYIEGYLFPVEEEGLREVTAEALRAHGLRDTGFSVEFRGHSVIEVNGRLGEDDGFPELFRAALGEYPILKHVAGRRAASRARGGHALAYASWYRGGVVRSAPQSEGVRVLVREGERLLAQQHPDFDPHLAWALASHPESAREAYASARAAVNALRFVIEPETD
jgi:hypothetical protein